MVQDRYVGDTIAPKFPILAAPVEFADGRPFEPESANVYSNETVGSGK